MYIYIHIFFSLTWSSGDAIGKRLCFSISVVTCFDMNLSALGRNGFLSFSLNTYQLVPHHFNSVYLKLNQVIKSRACFVKENSTSPTLYFKFVFKCDGKFCPLGHCVRESRLAHSSLTMLCITQMQMNYETIHLLEMLP